MEFEIRRSLEVLERTPRVLREMLHGMSDFWARPNYGDSTFSPFDVVGHLIEGERHDWMTRARLILDRGEGTPFKPFDRYAMYEWSKGWPMEDLLCEFATLRARNIADLRALDLTPDQLVKRGTHPAFGAVTLRQLLATWVVHDLGHTHQIAKAMSAEVSALPGRGPP